MFRRRPAPDIQPEWLIVGLGNPGKEYIHTRHNIGFLALDTFAKTLEADWQVNKKLHGEIAKGKIGRSVLILLKPNTFMNDSGEAVQAALAFYKLTPTDLIVVHDDKDIFLGETRVQIDRGPAGHNGVRSIIEMIGTQNFTRIRIGVAPKEQKIADTADFVLGKFNTEETKQFPTIFEHVAQELKSLV